MARGVIEDLEGSAPILFFPQCYSKYQVLISSDEPVIVKARISRDEENSAQDQEMQTPDLIAEEVLPLDGADMVLAKRVIVRVPGSLRKDALSAMKTAVMESKGPCSLCFEVETDGALVNIDAGKEYMVSPVRDFIHRLSEIVGPKGVELQ